MNDGNVLVRTHRGKFGAQKQAAFLEQIRAGMRRGAAAEAVGVHRETVRNAYNADPVFAAEVEKAEMDANEPVEDALYQAALSGNVVAIQVWLYNRMAGRWKDQRSVRVGGDPDGAPIDFALTVTVVDDRSP